MMYLGAFLSAVLGNALLFELTILVGFIIVLTVRHSLYNSLRYFARRRLTTETDPQAERNPRRGGRLPN